ncbi:protein mab-21-like isoform X2 [Montipora capricornis]|uniref:protein mab-21-like isoform X2 n=1 Tax=Montipora foliosa TaxID=591990 RepID=UPI0035F12F51
MGSRSLLVRSKWRVRAFYLLFAFVMVLCCFLLYYLVIREIVNDPFLQTRRFYEFQFKEQPVLVITFFVGCWLFPLVSYCWNHVNTYCPIRIKRRTCCFCKLARRQLVKILTSIHNTQGNWHSLDVDSLDDVTKKCIVLISNKTCATINCRHLEWKLVGSSAEGLGKSYVLDLKNSYRDQWCRFLLRFFCFCLPCNTSFTSLRTDIDVIVQYTDVMTKSLNETGSLFKIQDVSNGSGFVKLSLNPSTDENLASSWHPYCEHEEGQTYLSSGKVKKAVFKSVDSIEECNLPASRIFGPFRHPAVVELEPIGPAIKLTMYPIGQTWYWNENQKFVIFEADIVFGIHCYGQWPQCAREWFGRTRYWPTPKDVKHVLESGYILVPKSSQESSGVFDNYDLEWLVSFPHCETYLSQRIPEVAKACYLALKIIFKDHLSYYCKTLKTYQLKTVLFWELEKCPLEFWNILCIEKCFLHLLDSYIQCVSEKSLPSYWLDDHNLLRGSDHDAEMTDLLRILHKVRSNPAPFIEDIGSMWC